MAKSKRTYYLIVEFVSKFFYNFYNSCFYGEYYVDMACRYLLFILFYTPHAYYVSVFITDNRKSSGLPVAGIVAVVCSCLVLTACGSVAGIFVYRRWSIHIGLRL
jgi:hypothetical protein